jgi:hypothetical protein
MHGKRHAFVFLVGPMRLHIPELVDRPTGYSHEDLQATILMVMLSLAAATLLVHARTIMSKLMHACEATFKNQAEDSSEYFE